MKLERREDGQSYRFVLNDSGSTIVLSANQMSFLFNQFAKINLRDSIGYKVDELNGDQIDLTMYPDGDREAFIDEIFTDLEDKIDYGEMIDDDTIEEKILDTADYYEMCIDN